MENNKITEEVTITPVIRDIERLINKVLQLILFILRSILKSLKSLLRFTIENLRTLFILSLLGGILGFSSIFFVPQRFASSMVVGLNIDAKAQLLSDINYFSSLIKREQNEKIAEILQISKEDAESITKIEVKPHSSYIEQVEFMNKLYKSLDTNSHKHLNFNYLFSDEDSQLSRKFKITVYSTNEILFSSIEKPLITYLERVPELIEMVETSKRNLEFEKSIYMKEMANLDTLKLVMNEALLEEARSDKSSNSGTTISLGKKEESSNMSHLEIYNQYIIYAEKVKQIQSRINDFQNCYQVFSHFNAFGEKYGPGKGLRTLLAALSFFLIGLIYLSFKKNKQALLQS